MLIYDNSQMLSQKKFFLNLTTTFTMVVKLFSHSDLNLSYFILL